MTAHPPRKRRCPHCGRAVRITRNRKTLKDHAVDWRPGAPQCPGVGERAPTTNGET